MGKIEDALKERIKELTCLYEVSSIIVNADFDQIQETFRAIAFSLKKAFQFPDQTEIDIDTPIKKLNTGFIDISNSISGNINVFNKVEGKITASLKGGKSDFLMEEQQLLDNVALKLGNVLERIEIRNNEITHKRQMERADRLGVLGELTAGIAHELNTPLANILGFAELLKDNLGDNIEASADVEKIIQNAIFSREVVKKLMFFACEMPQEMKIINIVPILKSAIDLVDATFRKQEVKYEVKIQDEKMLLRADSLQLTQIVFNLIMNAIYFSKKNGLVTIIAFQTEKEVVLKVTDEGPGLSKKAIDKVFQPFFTTKPIGEGSGLGLSVVHGIVASHNGSIIAENNKDIGATFTVSLPKTHL